MPRNAKRSARTGQQSRTRAVRPPFSLYLISIYFVLTIVTELEAEIAHLKSRDKLSDEGKEKLAKLESELKFVTKAKEKYVATHPEAKDRVFNTGGERRGRGHAQHDDDEEDRGPRPDPMAHLYNPDGTLRDPKKSAYYDPTYNPFGVPPPGMPYRERSEYLVATGRLVTWLLVAATASLPIFGAVRFCPVAFH